jgi:glutamate racemase
MYVHDSEHVPYGGRQQGEIIQLTEMAIKPLLASDCDCIILACNTATAAAIEHLRAKYPDQKFVGLEPMVKPAIALTQTKIVAVFATPYTLSSERYVNLKKQFAGNTKVLEPDCSAWASMIEQSTVDEGHIEQTVDDSIERGADVIVLACTHYHWIKDLIIKRADGRATVIDPSEAISKQVASLLEVSL